jgi:hypothetical protein
MLILPMLLLLAQTPTLAPVGDETKDRTFVAYVKKLRAAAAKWDAKGLRKLTSADVITGGFTAKDERGWAKFAKRWELENEDSPVWNVLLDLLELGCFRQVPGLYVCSYVSWKFPRELDAETHLVVLRDNLPLRSRPERDAPAVATLRFDIVKRVGDASSGAFGWTAVETHAGVRGWVQSALVRSPLMSRAQFHLEAGQWLLTVLDRGIDGAR